MNSKQTEQIILLYYNFPEAEIDFQMQQKAYCFQWNFNRGRPVEVEVKKITYASDDQIKNYLEINIK